MADSMGLLVDTKVFLDVLLDREPFADESQAIIDWRDERTGEGWIAWHTLANLYYIGTKAAGQHAASACEAKVDWIVTRNLKGFKGSPIAAILPREFLRRQGTG